MAGGTGTRCARPRTMTSWTTARTSHGRCGVLAALPLPAVCQAAYVGCICRLHIGCIPPFPSCPLLPRPSLPPLWTQVDLMRSGGGANGWRPTQLYSSTGDALWDQIPYGSTDLAGDAPDVRNLPTRCRVLVGCRVHGTGCRVLGAGILGRAPPSPSPSHPITSRLSPLVLASHPPLLPHPTCVITSFTFPLCPCTLSLTHQSNHNPPILTLTLWPRPFTPKATPNGTLHPHLTLTLTLTLTPTAPSTLT